MNLQPNLHLPYVIELLTSSNNSKFHFKHSYCMIIREADERAGIKCLNKWQKIRAGDYVMIPGSTTHQLTGKLEYIRFKESNSERTQNIQVKEEIKIRPFANFGMEFFFQNDDFSLQKTHEDNILCLSKKADMTIAFNWKTLSKKVFGNTFVA